MELLRRRAQWREREEPHAVGDAGAVASAEASEAAAASVVASEEASEAEAAAEASGEHPEDADAAGEHPEADEEAVPTSRMLARARLKQNQTNYLQLQHQYLHHQKVRDDDKMM